MSREQGILRVLLGRPFDTLVSCGAQWENTRTGQDRTEECTTQYVLSGSSRFGQLDPTIKLMITFTYYISAFFVARDKCAQTCPFTSWG
jgi:hypothetical protein